MVLPCITAKTIVVSPPATENTEVNKEKGNPKWLPLYLNLFVD
jgi:hypothetical protein